MRTRSYGTGDLTNCNVITANLFTRRRIAGNTRLELWNGPPRGFHVFIRWISQAGKARLAYMLNYWNVRLSTNILMLICATISHIRNIKIYIVFILSPSAHITAIFFLINEDEHLSND